ncbi:MAG: hypothetical protein HY365_02755 [Candidatus Aenigmarchaeota archaeon]|nr:hypothetical protein [Candidatus Aenigmarchaeota archaeon]
MALHKKLGYWPLLRQYPDALVGMIVMPTTFCAKPDDTKAAFLGFVALSLLISSGVAFAVDAVMIATDITSVDMLVAKPAADKAGIPVLIAKDGFISGDVKEKISSLGVKKIIVVGGPAVVKPEAMAELSFAATVRLWGVERTGTALEVAKFFWPEGAGCAVLADDTKNPAADTELLIHASSLASGLKCMLIPVPAGTMPADVLAALRGLGVNETWIVSKTPDTSQLAKFSVKIVQGNAADEVGNEIESRARSEGVKPGMIIVAAQSFRDAAVIGAHPNNRSIIRFVSSMAEIGGIIEKIKESNITDVRVVGAPALSQQIASALAAQVSLKQVSGSHEEVSLKLLDEFRSEWEKTRNKETRAAGAARKRLLGVFNETENRLVELELEGAADSAAHLGKVREALDRLPSIRAKIIASPDVEGAKIELFNALSTVEEARWALREKLKIKITAEGEEEGLADKSAGISREISSMESRLARLGERCGATIDMEPFLSKVKSLKEEADSAIAAGDYSKGAMLLSEASASARIVRNMGEICEKNGKIEERLEKKAELAIKAKLPALEITSPGDGHIVRGTSAEVKVGVKNFILLPAGGAARKGEGHLHYYLDEKEAVSPETTHLFTGVPEGEHTIRVELHNNDHSLLKPPVAQVVTFEQTATGGSSSGGGY